MRYFLTLLAILVILVLSAALAVPYFVNWNAQRDLVAARISAFVGADVKISGSIDLKLLPTPYLDLGAVELADPSGKTTATIEEIRLEIALAPLLRGDVDFVEALLVRPRVHFEIDKGGVHLPEMAGLNGDLRFERISFRDGAISIADPATGRTYALADFDFEGEAPSLEGPFKGQGRIGRGAETSLFRFSTATLEDAQLRFKFILDQTRAHPRAELDGSLAFDPRGLAAALPRLDAKLTLTGETQAPIALPWRATGMVHAALQQASITDLDLRLGDEDHSVSLGGAAEFDFGASAHGRIGFKAKQVNLDRLLTDKTAAAPQRAESAFRAWLAHAAPAEIPLTIEWVIESALLGREAFTDISGALLFDKSTHPILRFQGQGPGQSLLTLDGKVTTGSAPAFDGEINLNVADLPRCQTWIANNLPDLGVADIALPVHALEAAGKANISTAGFLSSAVRLRLDRSVLAGSLAYTRAVGSEPPRFYADLASEALDLDHLPDLNAAMRAAKPMDLSLRLDSHAIKVADTGQGPIDAGRIVLKFSKTGSQMVLEKLDVTGLGGMTLSANGTLDGKTGKIDTKLDAESLADATDLVRRLFPGPAADILSARAANLSPAHLELAAEARGTNANKLVLSALSLKGQIGQTHVAANLAPESHNPARVAVSARLDSPEASALFRQLGISALPLKGVGGGEIDLSAQGELAKPLAAHITAMFAGTKLDFAGTLEPDLLKPGAVGTLKLASGDLSGLLQTTALAFPDLTGRLPADFTTAVEWRNGDVHLRNLEGSLAGRPVSADLDFSVSPQRHLSGTVEFATLSLNDILALAIGSPQMVKSGQIWSDQAFSVGLIDPPATSLSIKAKTFTLWPGITGKDARLNLDLAGGETGTTLGLRVIYMKLGSGGFEADLALRRDGAAASAQGHLTLQDYGFALPSVGGVVSADLDFASTGPNPAALMAGLAGSGSLAFVDLSLPHADPRAIARVFNAVEKDQLGIDEGGIARALTGELDKAPLRLPGARFELALAAGTLRIAPRSGTELESPAPDQKIGCNLQANLDMRTLMLDQRASITLANLPKNWQGAPPQISLAWKGPLTSPARMLDAAAFTNALAARAIIRESARIETQEFELHERAVFYQRLQSERRRERERQKAEEEAKRAADFAASLANANSDAHKTEEPAEPPPPPPGFFLRNPPLPRVRPQSLRVPGQ